MSRHTLSLSSNSRIVRDLVPWLLMSVSNSCRNLHSQLERIQSHGQPCKDWVVSTRSHVFKVVQDACENEIGLLSILERKNCMKGHAETARVVGKSLLRPLY